jgi:hypothetical protein
MNTEQFFNACKNFDWYYNYSDDHRVWRSGEAASKQLLEESKTDPIKSKIYTDWCIYINSSRRNEQPKWENYHD